MGDLPHPLHIRSPGSPIQTILFLSPHTSDNFQIFVLVQVHTNSPFFTRLSFKIVQSNLRNAFPPFLLHLGLCSSRQCFPFAYFPCEEQRVPSWEGLPNQMDRHP